MFPGSQASLTPRGGGGGSTPAPVRNATAGISGPAVTTIAAGGTAGVGAEAGNSGRCARSSAKVADGDITVRHAAACAPAWHRRACSRRHQLRQARREGPRRLRAGTPLPRLTQQRPRRRRRLRANERPPRPQVRRIPAMHSRIALLLQQQQRPPPAAPRGAMSR